MIRFESECGQLSCEPKSQQHCGLKSQEFAEQPRIENFLVEQLDEASDFGATLSTDRHLQHRRQVFQRRRQSPGNL